MGLSKTHRHRVTCLLKIRISAVVEQPPLYRSALSNVISVDSFLVGRATIVPLVTSSHGNVRLHSDEPAGDADNSDVPAAAMFQARSIGSARGSSRSSAQVRHDSRPSCSQPVARAHSRSLVHTAPGYLCPGRHRQAVKPLWFGWTLTQYLVKCA